MASGMEATAARVPIQGVWPLPPGGAGGGRSNNPPAPPAAAVPPQRYRRYRALYIQACACATRSCGRGSSVATPAL